MNKYLLKSMVCIYLYTGVSLVTFGQSIQCAEGDCNCLIQSVGQAQVTAAKYQAYKTNERFENIILSNLNIKQNCLDALSEVPASFSNSSAMSKLIKQLCNKFAEKTNAFINERFNDLGVNTMNNFNSAIQVINAATRSNAAPINTGSSKAMPDKPVDKSVLDKALCMIGFC